ncbi:MAG: WbqC family protein [Bacteroidales bacterium]|nr:WbqC family protein [Bacteroidales bacterium]
MAKYSVVYMEACENYQKQSWRNRCRILTANGAESLNVPVVHENGTFSLPIKEIRVEYTTPWVLRTERAIESAYSSSPFFIYYKDALFSILDSHPATLWELNRRIIDFFCAKIGIAPQILETTAFIQSSAGRISSPPAGLTAPPIAYDGPLPLSRGWRRSCEEDAAPADYRELIHPKRPNTIMRDLGLERPYWQVFQDKFGFVPGLSIMDLLFNEGPESICWLR